MSLQGVRSIKAVNEYCGYKVDIDKIGESYQDMKKEFKSKGISVANDILGIFDREPEQRALSRARKNQAVEEGRDK